MGILDSGQAQEKEKVKGLEEGEISGHSPP